MQHNLQQLSQREQEILIAVLSGNASAEIARKFEISIRTVDTHRRNIGKKLGSTHLTAYLKYALENKLPITKLLSA